MNGRGVSLVRALHGESSDGVEMLVRNQARPDGILVSVDGRPLDPSAGLHGAVAVFHDITELRRYEQDLSVFAGVVAHDLKAPLRAINGFAHLFEAEMEGQLSPQAREHLARIRNGSLRMATLIDDLLAYSHIDRRGLQSSLDCMTCTAYLKHNPGRLAELRERHHEAWAEIEPVITWMRDAAREHLKTMEAQP